MTPSQTRLSYIWLVIILLIAAFLRLSQPDVYVMWTDEVSIHHDAVTFARFGGVWPLIGNISTWGPLAFHSPFTTYLIAIPYLLSPDPAVARLFVGFLGILTVAIIYAMVHRYFGLTAAVIAGLIFAAFPLTVYWSRFVWNPNVGQPFLALWFFTALLGYFEGKRRAQIGHWLALAAAIQAQAALASLLPASVLLAVYHWLTRREKRRQIALCTALGIVLAVLTFIPWMVGLARVERHTSNPGIALALPDFGVMIHDFAALVGAVDFPDTIGWSKNGGGIWSQTPIHVVGWVQVGIVILGIFWLLRRWWKDPVEGFPGGFLALMCLYPFGMFLARSTMPNFYLMPVVFAAIPVLGITLSQFWTRPGAAKKALVAGVTALVIAHAALGYALTDWYRREGGDYPTGTLASVKAEIANWQSLGGRDIIVLREPDVEGNLIPLDRYGNDEITLFWEILAAKYPIRFVKDPLRLPVSPAGQVLVGFKQSPTLNHYIDQGLPHGIRPNNDRYEWVILTPDDLPEANMHPDEAATFGQYIRVIGASVEDKPHAGGAWSVQLLWSPLVDSIGGPIQFSLRLLDDSDNRYGQVDESTLSGDLWQRDDIVLSQFTLPVADSMPDDTEFSLEIIAYTYPDMQTLDVVDENGNPVNWRVILRSEQ